jgi:hypothetical protein
LFLASRPSSFRRPTPGRDTQGARGTLALRTCCLPPGPQPGRSVRSRHRASWRPTVIRHRIQTAGGLSRLQRVEELQPEQRGSSHAKARRGKVVTWTALTLNALVCLCLLGWLGDLFMDLSPHRIPAASFVKWPVGTTQRSPEAGGSLQTSPLTIGARPSAIYAHALSLPAPRDGSGDLMPIEQMRGP